RLPQVLRGDIALDKVVEAENAGGALEHYLSDSWSYRSCNARVAETCAWALKEKPLGRKARILEISARAGGLTGELLARLPENDIELVVAAATGPCSAEVEGRCGGRRGVHVVRYDPADGPRPADLAAPGFDVIIGCDALLSRPGAEASARRLVDALA